MEKNFDLDNKYPAILEVKELMEILRVSRWAVYQLIQVKEVGSFRFGKVYKITKNSLTQYIDVLENRYQLIYLM